MPPTPVDDHTEEFEQLAGLAALEVLEGEELALFEGHAAHCERCQVMVRLDREALALAAPEMDPSPDFKARLMQRAADELARTQPPPDTTTQPSPRTEATSPPATMARAEVHATNVIQFPWWRRAPRWASAVAAVFVVGVVALGGYGYENQIVASYPLTGTLAGSAVVNVRRSGAANLELRGLANPPPGSLYEAWLIPQGGAPIPAGTATSGDASLPLNGVGTGVTVAITQERQRVDAPTSAPVLAVQL